MPTTIQYALMAAASYISTRPFDVNKFPVPAGWNISKVHALPSGFEAATFKNGSELVISFAGTYPGVLPGTTNGSSLGMPVDFFADLGLGLGTGSDQLLQAVEYYLDRKRENPGATITFTGHSLGGGLAALVGVFFGLPAVTFDQAPFANSAQDSSFISNPLNLLVSDVATKLKTDLLADGYTAAELSPLSNYLTIRPTGGGIPNANLVTTTRVDGEFLSDWVPISMYDIIGNPATVIQHAPTSATGIDLHAQSLLIAFLQSEQYAQIDPATGQKQTLNQVTYKLTDLLGMIFNPNLYSFDTDKVQENFLERLVRHEAGSAPLPNGGTVTADAMVTRFTRDLWKLAQDGGLTLNDGNGAGGTTYSNQNNVSKALTAFAMQMYYEDTANATNASKELFTQVTGGVQFDMADVSKTFALAVTKNEKFNLNDAKGYKEYFAKYLSDNPKEFFTLAERNLITAMLPYMRDWYIQAGASAMIVADDKNRGAFMLGGSGTDALIGGTGADLLVGNGGADTLMGKEGNDYLLGGAGSDNYIYRTGDGLDTLLDFGGEGSIVFDGVTLSGGAQYGDDRVYRSADKQHLYVMAKPSGLFSTGTLIIDGSIIVNNYIPSSSAGQLNLNLTGPTALTNPATTRTINGELSPADIDPGTPGIQAQRDAQGNLIGTAQPYEDILVGGAGNDHMISGTLDDNLGGRAGHDWIEAGTGNDHAFGDEGDDLIEGGAGTDILIGGTGDDRLYADTQISVAQAIANGNAQTGSGLKGDWLIGGAANDYNYGLERRAA